jgi:hypothetical protein
MGGFFKSVGNFLGDLVGGIGKAIGSVFKSIGSAIGGMFGAVVPDINVPEIEADVGAEGVKVTKNGTQMSIPVCYGFRRLGGRIIFAETNGSKNSDLYVVYAICEGPIYGIKRIMIQDVEIPQPYTDAQGVYQNGVTYNISQGRYSGRLSIQVFNDGGSSSLAKGSASWGNALRNAPGLAYAVCKYTWKEIKTQEDADANPYTGGIPTIQFDVLGKRVYDVTQHIGGNLNLSADYNSLSKASHSYNPVNNLLDYLMNPRYGCGVPKEQIDADSFKLAAMKCAQQITYSTGVTGKAITCNAVISTESTLFDNVKRLLSGCRGLMPFIQGRYKIKIEDGGHPYDITSSNIQSAFDVTNDHIVGDLTIQGEQKANKYNQVIVKYIDPDKEFTEQEAVYTESADVSADGEDLVGEFEFFTINSPNLAYDIARMIYKKSRNQRYISFTASPELLAVEPGDVITVTNSVLNLSAVAFRVTNMNFTNEGNVSIQAKEHIASIYPYVPNAQVVLPAQVYKPDNYSLTPLTKTNPAKPISVVPPNDEEEAITDYDSALTAVTDPPAEDNNTLPQAPDITATTSVTRFRQVSRHNGIKPNSSLQVGGGYTSTYNTFLTNPEYFGGLNDWGWSWISAFPNLGISDGVGQYTLSFEYLPPDDSALTMLRLYFYDRTSRQIVRIADYPHTQTTQPQKIQLENIPVNTYIVVRFRNDYDNKEYLDGSVDTLPTRTYTNLLGQSVTGHNLESELNYTLQVDTKYDRYEDNASNSWSLGG